MTRSSHRTSISWIKEILINFKRDFYLDGFSDEFKNIGSDANKDQKNLRKLVSRHSFRFGQHPATDDNDEQNQLMQNVDPGIVRVENRDISVDLKITFEI